MLTGVNYSDGTSASYEYRNDNVIESPTSHKQYPLLQKAVDVRYNGPMRTIRYDYQNNGPHGAIIDEKYPGIGAVSAITPGLPSIAGNMPQTFTETRGDGPPRTFTYTPFAHYTEGVCDDYQNNWPPQQMLDHYTDFQGHTTYLGYDSNWYINSVRDANNHTTTYTRGPGPPTGIGQITRITHPDTTHIDYTYYNEGTGRIGGHYIQTVSDERRNVTVYNRDGNYRVTSIDYKDSQGNVLAHEEFVYNGFGQVTRHKLKNGNYVHYQYDGRGLLLYKWNPTPNATAQGGDPKTTYAYYGSGWWKDRVWRETLPANVSGSTAWETYEYDRNTGGGACAGRGLVTKITHADGKWQSSGYSQFGNKMWEENELRQRTSYAYDNYNRVLSVTNPMYKTEYFAYLKPGTNSPYLHTTSSVYMHTSGAGIVTSNVYDQNFRKTSTTTAGATTSFVYDNVGNLAWVTDPQNHITHNSYDNRNRKTSATEAWGSNLAATTVWHYDGASNINGIDRPDGRRETKGYDGLNRMVWNIVPQSPSVNLHTWFGYNPSGTLQWVKDANLHVTTFNYDASDRKTKMTYPGTSQFQAWNFDNAGNLANRTTVGGKTQSFSYDSRNRKTGMTWSNGVDSATYGYDAASRLTSATNANSAVTRTYYADGRVMHDLQAVVGGPSKEANYVYDGDGNVTWMNVDPYDSPSYNWDFSYDGMGRLGTISPHGGSVAFQYQYDAGSNVIHRYTYLSGNVTIDQNTARDSLNRVYVRYEKKGATLLPLTTEVYTYDRMNQLTEVDRDDFKKDTFFYYNNGEMMWGAYGQPFTDPIQEQPDPDMDTTDNTDPFADYQPPETAEPEPPAPDSNGGPPAAPDFSQQMTANPESWAVYSMDKAGNRTLVSNANGNISYSPNNLNQYTGSVGAASISNGSEHEVSGYNGVNYNYINDEHLKQVVWGSSTYNLYYDALGRCVKRTLGNVTTYYIYDGDKPVLEYKSSDLSHPARNLYGKGIDEILMRTDPTVNSGQPFYYMQDREGSVTHLFNGSGNVIESYRYDAFGAPMMYNSGNTQIPSTAYNNRFLFTGREYAATYQKTYVSAFNFYEYRARAYNPALGRFMSEDPKLFDAGDYNLFRYCHNDPLDFTDPMGLEEKKEPWYNHQEQAKALDREYGRMMAAAQWAGSNLLHGVSGATGIGTAAYNAWSTLRSLSMAQITKGNASQPQLKQYSTRQDAGRAALTGDYDGVQLDQAAHEYGNWLLQQNGVQSGHYAFVPGIPGSVQYVPELRQKMQTTTLLAKNIPPGYHAIGWHYAQVRHADYVPAFDRQVADQHGWFVALRVPGAGGNWARPNTFFYPPGD